MERQQTGGHRRAGPASRPWRKLLETRSAPASVAARGHQLPKRLSASSRAAARDTPKSLNITEPRPPRDCRPPPPRRLTLEIALISPPAPFSLPPVTRPPCTNPSGQSPRARTPTYLPTPQPEPVSSPAESAVEPSTTLRRLNGFAGSRQPLDGDEHAERQWYVHGLRVLPPAEPLLPGSSTAAVGQMRKDTVVPRGREVLRDMSIPAHKSFKLHLEVARLVAAFAESDSSLPLNSLLPETCMTSTADTVQASHNKIPLRRRKRCRLGLPKTTALAIFCHMARAPPWPSTPPGTASLLTRV